MMEISCEVIRDLLPLYHDGVCSEESRRLVEAHLEHCPSCRETLSNFDEEAPKMENQTEANLIRETAKTWKKNKLASFFKGGMLMCILACLSCAVAYEAIGSHIAEDGRLVEPFGLIPLFWLFLLIGAVFTAGFLIARRHPKKAAR